MTKGPNMAKVLYFAYGSNMSSDRIHLNNKSAVYKSVGVLKGYKLEFNFNSKRWGGAAANIIPVPAPDRESSQVYGVLWELERYDRENLDKQEGVDAGIYQRIYVNSEIDGEYHECLSYQLTEQTRSASIAALGANLKPSKIYKSVMIQGAREHGIPQEYVDFLENIPDNGFNGPVDHGVD